MGSALPARARRSGARCALSSSTQLISLAELLPSLPLAAFERAGFHGLKSLQELLVHRPAGALSSGRLRLVFARLGFRSLGAPKRPARGSRLLALLVGPHIFCTGVRPGALGVSRAAGVPHPEPRRRRPPRQGYPVVRVVCFPRLSFGLSSDHLGDECRMSGDLRRSNVALDVVPVFRHKSHRRLPSGRTLSRTWPDRVLTKDLLSASHGSPVIELGHLVPRSSSSQPHLAALHDDAKVPIDDPKDLDHHPQCVETVLAGIAFRFSDEARALSKRRPGLCASRLPARKNDGPSARGLADPVEQRLLPDTNVSGLFLQGVASRLSALFLLHLGREICVESRFCRSVGGIISQLELLRSSPGCHFSQLSRLPLRRTPSGSSTFPCWKLLSSLGLPSQRLRARPCLSTSLEFPALPKYLGPSLFLSSSPWGSPGQRLR